MKKITLLISIAITFTLSLNAWTIDNLGTYQFDKVNENVWVMHGPVMMPNKLNGGFMNNPAVIESENGLIVIDPGGNYNIGVHILKEVQKILDNDFHLYELEFELIKEEKSKRTIIFRQVEQ